MLWTFSNLNHSIWSSYEKDMKQTSFGIQNTKLGLIPQFTKRLGFSLQKYMGLRVKTGDGGLILTKPMVSLANLPREGVSTDLDRTIADQQPGLDLSERACVCVDASAGWQAG
jgi:hypothetical protein